MLSGISISVEHDDTCKENRMITTCVDDMNLNVDEYEFELCVPYHFVNFEQSSYWRVVDF